jgi:arginyl-tRNA synthetase
LEKDSKEEIDEQKIQTISIAALKWMDLHRDREQDVIFDLDRFLKFEGNTGVYQLYTVVRLNSILENNAAIRKNLKIIIKDNFLNQEELDILKKTYTLPLVLEKICQNYKPHHLCNYLFELTTDINSWYSKYSVTNETNESRKYALLLLCEYLKAHLSFGLSLLGINTVDKL